MFKAFVKIKLIIGALIAAISFFGGAFAARSVSAESSGIAVQYDLFSAGFAGNTFSASEVFTPTVITSGGDAYVDVNEGMLRISDIQIIDSTVSGEERTLYAISGSSTITSEPDAYGGQYGMISVSLRLYTKTNESMYEDLAPGTVFTYIYCGKSSYMNADIQVGQELFSYISEQIPNPNIPGNLNYVAIEAAEVYDTLTTTNYSPYISVSADNNLYEIVPAQMAIYGAETPASFITNHLRFNYALISPYAIYNSTNRPDSLYYDSDSGYNFAYIISPTLTNNYTLTNFNLGQSSPYNLVVDAFQIEYGDKTLNYSATLRPKSGYITTPIRGSDEYGDFINSMHIVMNNAPDAPPDAPQATPPSEPEPEPDTQDQPKYDAGTLIAALIATLLFPVAGIAMGIVMAVTGLSAPAAASTVVNGIRSVLIPIGDFIVTVVNWIGRLFESVVRVVERLPGLINNVVDPPFNFILFFAILAAIIITIAIILKKRR